jgi:hypothetical protein
MRQHNLRVTGSLTVNGENVVSASQLSVLNSTLTGQYATTGSNSYNGNQTITGSLLVTGVITANEFHTTFVTSSVLYTSGSTKFGDSNDDIMEVTGSLKVNGNITANNLSGIVSGSTQITSLLPTGVVSGSSQTILNLPTGTVSGSSQLTASYDVRYVISGSITQTTWDNIASKPAGIVSSSAQVILQSTTGQLSASRVDGLNLSQIASGSYTASIGQTFNVNTSTIITGSLSVSSLSGSGVNYLAYSGGVVTAISGTAAIKYTQEFSASLGQTTFTPSVGYVSGLIDVYYNGTKLSAQTDYTASNGSTIVLSQGADLAGDIVEVTIYNPVNGVSNNVLRQQTTFTASAAQTTFTVNYTPGLLDVYFNGSRLSNEEYTANNGTSIILSEATTGGEIIDIFVYSYQVGAFSGVGGQGVTNQLAYWSSQSGLTGSNSLTFDGTTLTISGSLVPAVSGAYDLGSTSKPFRHIYVGSGSIFLVNNQGQVTNTISAQSIVTTDTLNSGSIDLTKSLPTGTVSGSSQVVGILTSLNSATASFTPRISNLESKSASVDISITNINSVTASNIARLNNLETKSASVDITISSINSKTGSYATTGSNTFFGTQTYSGSVYIANDLVVQGSSSIQYISASSVSIGTNIVQLNTANPSVRFAGLTIIDSGSVGGSGSFLYDSVQDEFIFVHRGNGTNITSSHFVLGPETYDSLGNETYLTSNIIPKGTGKEHLIDSCIFDNGTTTCIKNNLIGTGTITGTTIYGSTAVCSANGLLIGNGGVTATCNYLPKFTGASTIGDSQVYDNGTSVGINQPSPTRTLDILGASGIGTVLKLQGASGTTTYLQLAYNGATNAQSGYIGYNSNSQMQFFTNDTVALTIDSNRNLGLGVTPSVWGSNSFAFQTQGGAVWSFSSAYMDVWQNSYYNGTSSIYTTTAAASFYRQAAGSHEWNIAPSGTAGCTITWTNGMTLTNGGNVGIGTGSPLSKLEVQKTGAQAAGIFINQCSSDEATIRFKSTHSCLSDFRVGASILAGSAFEIYNVQCNRTNYMVNCLGFSKISNDGTFVNGNNTNYHSMNSSGDVTLYLYNSNATGNGILSNVQSCNTSYYSFRGYSDPYGDMAFIYSNGTFGSRTGTYGGIVSDARCKTEICDASSQWNDIKNLRVRNFKLIEDVENDPINAMRQIGFIAQEVETVSPGLVFESGNGCVDSGCWKNVKTSIIHTKAVKALQEAMCRIEILESCLGIS